ncbi:hypothetical protein K438DRAFT_836284 [Mycena galopus ATCC 62051]|nr:hypothetical protein K438DRAFT_836284 [Mycena galopus ATCC 62051]
MAPPTLPPELEREIFELCARSLPVFMPQLLLVAHRVKEWIEPLLYRTMIVGRNKPIAGFPLLHNDAVLSIGRRKPPGFCRRTVRHLMLLYSPSVDFHGILALCSGVEDLLLQTALDDTLLPLIDAMPLRRLSADFDMMPPATHPMFSRLTHLHLGDDPVNAGELPEILAALPKLTHLSLDGDISVLMSPEILASSQSLRALVFFEYDPRVWSDEVAAQLTRDIRFVVMPVPDFAEDWYAGLQHGTDYWSEAETFVAKRRTGEIDPLHCNWP